MSGLINKVKDALHGDKHHDPSAPLANEHGTQSGVHDTSSSVAHGSSISPTNPGMLHSTETGIHGQRDPGTGTSTSLGTSGNDSRLTDTTRGSNLGTSTTGGDTSLGHGSTLGGTGSGVTDTTTTGTGGGSAGPQFTGDNTRDTGLVGSGLTGSGARTGETGAGMAGTGYDDRNRDTTLGGAGGVTGSGTRSGLGGNTSTRDTGLTDSTTTGSGFGADKRDAGVVGGGLGEGLVGEGGRNRGDLSNTGTGSGLGGSGGSGLGGVGTDSGYGDNSNTTGLGSGTSGTGLGSDTSGTGLGSGTSGTGLGSNTTGSGIGSEAERYVEGTERHHRGDGHPEDIVHPGPHVTGTAKALDPHLN